MQELVKVDANEQIRRFHEFLESYYYENIIKNLRKDLKFVVVDFAELSKFDLDLANELLENPEDTIKAAEISLQQFDLEEINGAKVRFSNLPKNQKIMVRNIRSKHIGKLMEVEGIVRQKSDVRPQVTAARFECPVCGNIINVLQLNGSFREPSKCGCGRKGKFTLLSKELVDAQGIVLEETPESLEGGEQPKRANIFLKDDLVSPLSERKTNPGSKIDVVGIVKEVPIIQKTGTKSTRFDLMIEANYVGSVEETFYEIDITEEEERKIKELSQDPDLFRKLINSVAPSIYGYEKVKESLLLQLVGGVRKVRSDKVVSRGDMHVLLVGDPGSGKSALLKRVSTISPKGRYVSGRGVSGAGLTATVVRDEFLRGWSLEAGAIVLANKGLVCIDELEKMDPQDRSAMHEAMEQQTVTISKANVQASLRAETSVLAAANPKFGRFDPYQPIAQQIDLPPTLINRFDIIFTLRDLPDRKKDARIATHVLSEHSKETEIPLVSRDLLRKYVAYAKQKIKPVLTKEAIEELKNFYVELRNKAVSSESAVRPIPISARQLQALVRMSEASAKVRLSEVVSKQDAQQSIEIIKYYLMQVGYDYESHAFDIDRINAGFSHSQRSKIFAVKETITALSSRMCKVIPIEEIKNDLKDKMKEQDIDEAIEKLIQSNEIYRPKYGYVGVF